MSLKINSVINASTPNGEIVWLQASEKVNLKGYAVVDRTFDTDGSISNEFRHIFVFPKLDLKKDDWIRLSTGNGKYYTYQNPGNETETVHCFYWQSDKCVWNNNGGDTASLIKFNLVNSVTVPAVKK